jgi:transcriptional regulator with XRE-family HTH domain
MTSVYRWRICRRNFWYPLGIVVRRWRKAAGVSQQYVSDQLMLLGYDLCQESISSTEIGDREISAVEFWLIAHVLNVDEQTVLQALRDILK